MAANPYESPTTIAGKGFRDIAGLGLCGYFSLPLAAIVPLVIVWDYVAVHWRLLPRLPMGEWYFNVLFTVAVFLLTILSVPLGTAGLFSRARVLAAVGALFGSLNTLIIFYLKFYPVLVFHFK